MYTITVDGLEETRITNNPATDATASWSPDGNYLVFHSDRDGDEEIYIISLDGTEIMKLTDNNESDYIADWAP